MSDFGCWMIHLAIIALLLLVSTASSCSTADLRQHRERRQASRTPFKYYWVTQCGVSGDKTKPSSLEVRGTAEVNEQTVEKAARLVHRVVAFMSPTLFKRVADIVSVGIYYKHLELPTVFPEYTPKEGCKYSCVGGCQQTCSSANMPLSLLISYGGRLVVVPSENINCSPSNPSRMENLLVKEFSKALLDYALTGPYREMLDAAYEDVVSVWGKKLDMATYFTQASLAWFLASGATAFYSHGMNRCDGRICEGELNSRNNLKYKDIKLYETLDNIYNYNRSYIYAGVTMCQW